MSSQKDNSNICPDCGVVNTPIEDAWLEIMNDEESIKCSNCNRSIYNSQDSDHDDSIKSGSIVRFLLIIAFLFGIIFFLNSYFDVLSLKRDFESIIYYIVLLVLISSTLAYGSFSQKLRYLSIWAGIFLILIIGYSYRYELFKVKDKVLTELIPAKGIQNTHDSISFPVSSDGHFYIRASVNSIPIYFLADTGASSIVLSPGDAEKLGIKTTELDFNQSFETANGIVRGSSIRINDFRIGNIHLNNIRASVNEAEMSFSLLGMTFFKQMKSFEIKNDVLTLYWKP